jgi:urease accessory protein
MLTLTRRVLVEANVTADRFLALDSEDRVRSRHQFETEDGEIVYLNLPRGTVLFHGDFLQSDTGCLVQVLAKPENVMTVTARSPLDLLRATYHLGNRHVPLEVAESYLRLAPDPVLKVMLEQLGLTVREEIQPFHPESGAYHHHHGTPIAVSPVNSTSATSAAPSPVHPGRSPDPDHDHSASHHHHSHHHH